MPRSYNKRSGDVVANDLQYETRRSPRTKVRSPRSTDDSRYSNDESDCDEDRANWSYPSTQASPSAITPSPSQINMRFSEVRANSHISEEHFGNTPKKDLYPDLSKLSESSPERQRESPNLPAMKQRNRNQSAHQESDYPSSSVYAVCVVLGSVIILALGVWLFPTSNPPTRSEAFKEFIQQINSLTLTFKHQESRTWKSVKSAVKHVLNSTNPRYPAVVLFAVEKEYNFVASCLARQISTSFNMVTKGIKYDGYLDLRLLKSFEVARQKKSLDQNIHSFFRAGRSVVLDHLEVLSPDSTILLHGICDNENAPFKDVFIGIVFNVDRKISASDVDGELTRYLSKSLDVDKIGPLLTRINNNAVVVDQEVAKHLSHECA